MHNILLNGSLLPNTENLYPISDEHVLLSITSPDLTLKRYALFKTLSGTVISATL